MAKFAPLKKCNPMKFNFLVLMLIVFSITACDNENAPDCLKKTGEISTKTIELNEFKHLELNDLFKVKLIQDTENKLVIKGGKNMIPKVAITETEGSLIVENLNTCNWTRSYQKVVELDLHFTKLDSITVFGQVDLYSTDTIKANFFTIIFRSKASKANLIFDAYLLNFQIWQGTGEYYLSGKARYFWCYGGPYPYIYAENFKTENVYVENYSTGDFTMSISETIQAKLSSYGNVIYYGNPKILVKEISSTGNLIQKSN